MPASPIRLVVDTNVILRGLLNTGSPSGRVLDLVESRLVLLLLSRPVLAEYRAVLGDAVIVERFPELTEERVEVALRRMRYLGEYVRTVRARFDFPEIRGTKSCSNWQSRAEPRIWSVRITIYLASRAVTEMPRSEYGSVCPSFGSFPQLISYG